MSNGMRWTQSQLESHYQTKAMARVLPITKTTSLIAAQKILSAKAPKYRNIKTIVDGIIFDSILEADYYRFLNSVRVWGLIDNIHRQMPLRLEGGVRLVVDFMCTKRMGATERIWWDDCKGFLTPGANNKLKMAKDRFGIDVRLIKRGMIKPDLFK